MALIRNPGLALQVGATYRRKLSPRNWALKPNHKLFSETQQ
ncbi:hypothetical protein [Methyloglobulus sp.]